MHTEQLIDEDHRLAALYRCNILDSQPEIAFDRLTKLAAHLFEVPIASVSLLDRDRLFLKSRLGVDLQEVPRERAFCTNTVTFNRPLVVLDATLDPGFSDNPFVTANSGIRFYAGVPIYSPDGYPVGALCIADCRPRENWGQGQLDLLTELAAIATDELRLRVQNQEILALNRALQHRAHHDALTGLPNRCHFESRLQQALQTADANLQTALLFIDLDGFKAVNDNFGHHVGDQFLIGVADRLRASVRDRGLLARLGGDEFVVLFEQLNDLTEVNHLPLDIRESFAPAIRVHDLHLFANASIGISVAPDDGTDPVSLLRNADLAMYSAKLQKGDQSLCAPSNAAKPLLKNNAATLARRSVRNDHPKGQPKTEKRRPNLIFSSR